MLVVRYYKYDASSNLYYPDCIFCDSIEACADGNVRLLACNFDKDNPLSAIIIKANQLISIRVKAEDTKSLNKVGD